MAPPVSMEDQLSSFQIEKYQKDIDLMNCKY